MKHLILAIDPGDVRSAYSLLDPIKLNLVDMGLVDNSVLIADILSGKFEGVGEVVIEYPQPRGQPMYTQLVDAIFWIGRFAQALGGQVALMDRKDVKMHLCFTPRAKDSNVRAALMSYFALDERFLPGDGKTPVIGNKRKRGPLYGVRKDIWAALAVAITHMDKLKESESEDMDFLD